MKGTSAPDNIKLVMEEINCLEENKLCTYVDICARVCVRACKWLDLTVSHPLLFFV